jgi:putative nucleotidyltransferase with HDIG domain
MTTRKRHVRTVYLVTVVSLGVITVTWSLWQMSTHPPGTGWFWLAALTLFTGSFTVKLPFIPAKISVSDTFVFTSALLFGQAAGTITVVLDALVASLFMERTQRTPVRVIFNATGPAIAFRVASETFFFLAGIEPGHIDRTDLGQMIAPVFAFALVYFAINAGLVAGAVATERDESAFRIALENFPPVSITYFVGSSIAMLIVAYTDQIDLTVLSIIVPLIIISHLTFRNSMARLQDAERHLEQVNEMYLSTVETLAMAVDAKDQITHGHIRRVQVYALELAKRLGVSNHNQLKGLEAAALLHDMGKLAIPEHILNKPGKLTFTEFAKMKRHASIGADLLSAIRFPYPVVPIVRHHHENWDGTGYPSGIAGTDIPVGARILSVVDCFDALTSDRPYRPRLTVDEAFAILRERRGAMYDPMVVDGFIAAYPHISPGAIRAGQQASTVMAPSQTDGADSITPLRRIRENAAEASTLADFASRIENGGNGEDAISLTAQFVRRLTPSAVCAVYLYAADADVLRCVESVGDSSHLLTGLTIRKGERVSGWAAANERTIANSQAVLDLGEIVNSFSPPLRSALAGPLIHKGRLVGVVAGYATRDDVFTEDHHYAFEQLLVIASAHVATLGTSTTSGGVIRFPSAEHR